MTALFFCLITPGQIYVGTRYVKKVIVIKIDRALYHSIYEPYIVLSIIVIVCQLLLLLSIYIFFLPFLLLSVYDRSKYTFIVIIGLKWHSLLFGNNHKLVLVFAVV